MAQIPTDTIVTRGLTKTFGRARVPIVTDLNLVVPRGAVYGFIGPNGSGKTTTMKMLLGLEQPSGGEIDLFGTTLAPNTWRRLIARCGALIENPPGYGHLTGRENLRIVQHLRGVDDRRIDDVMDLVRLRDHQHKLVRTYSLGMKQRLGIAIALAHHPELVILDEPTNGLDPAGIEEIRRLIASLSERGVTVLVASHLLDEVEKVTTHLGIIGAGNLIFQGTRAELMAHTTADTLLTTRTPVDTAGLSASTGVELAEEPSDGGQPRYRVSGVADVGALNTLLVNRGVEVTSLQQVTPSLEDVFLRLTAKAQL
ncbi:ABC transporter ATP-binding protein [Corynebacterium uterequi]|uniref:ABC-type multidrug transport system, ATPase component n=1 Tax=Corynebacterium uterequi TaxID=1072256 RepID=A0A0G3HCX2_9CORY|nr:ATP-binding cassette domain-containing protein [Corynebacterium uterequi]AKK10570.1 ABC-type multidrug transport system, ATPase component [Corynebacterium uterequi]